MMMLVKPWRRKLMARFHSLDAVLFVDLNCRRDFLNVFKFECPFGIHCSQLNSDFELQITDVLQFFSPAMLQKQRISRKLRKLILEILFAIFSKISPAPIV